MRGRDPDTGDFLSPSRSQQRRDALAVFVLAERLVALSDAQLDAVPMPDALRDLVRESRRITSHVARKRQLQFLAKAMRNDDDEVIEAIRAALEQDREQSRRDTAGLQRVEFFSGPGDDGRDAARAVVSGITGQGGQVQHGDDGLSDVENLVEPGDGHGVPFSVQVGKQGIRRVGPC